MITRNNMPEIVYGALKDLGGSAEIVKVAEKIWGKHEEEIRQSGDMLFKWQYDMRWGATELRKQGKMKDSEDSPRGMWELSE